MIECNVTNSKNFDFVVNFENKQFRNLILLSLFDQWINFMCMICNAKKNFTTTQKSIESEHYCICYDIAKKKHLDSDSLKWLFLWNEFFQAINAKESWFSTKYTSISMIEIFLWLIMISNDICICIDRIYHVFDHSFRSFDLFES